MRRISSRMTFFNKWVFPVIFLGFVIVFFAIQFFFVKDRAPLPFLVVPAFFIVFAYFIMRKLVFDLVDEVWEDGDTLVVKNRGEEERIALSDIKNISYAPYMNPPRVTLSLRRSTVFGDEIVFSAPIRLVPFSKSPLITDLIDRVDRARIAKRA